MDTINKDYKTIAAEFKAKQEARADKSSKYYVEEINYPIEEIPFSKGPMKRTGDFYFPAHHLNLDT
jgi:hypothetical protein